MNFDGANLLSSVVFVLFGATSFRISCLVSGFDIYRDRPAYQAGLLTITVGVVVFLLSPIGFLVFYPSLFPTPHLHGVSGRFLVPPETLLGIWDSGLSVFLLAAIGLGLLSGALAFLEARTQLIGWLKRSTRLQFVTYDYTPPWDAFLGAVRKGGEVTVNGEGQSYTGKLHAWSAASETHALWLRDSSETSLSDDLASPSKKSPPVASEDEAPPDTLLLGQGIRAIRAPEHALNKHRDSAPHTGQALYLWIAAVGALLVAHASWKTGAFLESSPLSRMRVFYVGVAELALALAFALLCVAVPVAGADYRGSGACWGLRPRLFACAVITPVIPLVSAILSAIFLGASHGMLEDAALSTAVSPLVPLVPLGVATVCLASSAFFALVGLLAVYFRWDRRPGGRSRFFKQRTGGVLGDLASICSNHPKLLEKALTYICTERGPATGLDMASGCTAQQWRKFLDPAIRAGCSEEQCQRLADRLRDFTYDHWYLEKNAFLLLRALLLLHRYRTRFE